MSDLPTPCALPGCWALCPQPEGAGRPRRYCSDEHRREADTMRKRTVARLNLLRDQVRRDEHLLAALGGEDEEERQAKLRRIFGEPVPGGEQP